MLVNVTGCKCISCSKFTQYYTINIYGEVQRTDCGYCGQRSRKVRPGDRCNMYHEQSNVYSVPKNVKPWEV